MSQSEAFMSKNRIVSVSLTQTEEFQQLCNLAEEMSRTLSFYANGGKDKGKKAQSQLVAYDETINTLIDRGFIGVNHTPPARGDDTMELF